MKMQVNDNGINNKFLQVFLALLERPDLRFSGDRGTTGLFGFSDK